VSQAVKVGEPTMFPREPLSATKVQQESIAAVLAPPGKNTLGVEIVKPDTPVPSEPAPTNDATGTSPFGKPTTPENPPQAASDANELKPNVPGDSNEIKPIDNGTDQSLPPPAQVNEIQQGQTSVSADNTPASDQEISSSRKKKKKGIKKIVPF
jgi:hypothetical protein